MTRADVIHAHRGHRFLILMTLIVVLVIGFLLGKSMANLYVAEDNYRTLVVGLLFVLNLSIIIFIMIVAHFMIEVKALIFKEDEALLREEMLIEKELDTIKAKKKAKKK